MLHAIGRWSAVFRMHIRPSGNFWHAVSEKLRATLVDMKKAAGGDAERPKVAWATMLKLVGNVVKVRNLDKPMQCCMLHQQAEQHPGQAAAAVSGPL
jgi:hypothetical protein